MESLQDRVVLVTGSSRGIGAAIAREFADHGARVAVHGRDRAAVEGVRAEIASRGGRAIGVVADVTRLADIEAMRQTIERELGPVEILVANAGGSITPPGPIEDTTEDGWRASVDANLTATFLTVKSVLPGMKQRRRGSIVTVSSSAAGTPTARSPVPYAAAKAGIEVLTRIVAVQAGPFNVRVNCVAPETILTEGNLQRIPGPMQTELAGMHPLQRLGTAQDVARTVRFLASESDGWITGVVLTVDGGGLTPAILSAVRR
jgi:3-oxoacyl-[acyl-carrier protein] reductase